MMTLAQQQSELHQSLLSLHPIIAIIDLESTGGHFYTDRITEVALIKISAEGISHQSWLINPQQSIPPFVANLTGIDDELVKDAPTFQELAQVLHQELNQALIIAHNTRFDYHFLRHEFMRAGLTFRAPELCTVKFSRKLYPQHHKHNLDSIIARFNIQLLDRHRAMPDAEAVYQLLNISRQEIGQAPWLAQAKALISPHALNPQTPASLAEALNALPDEAGTVLFYDADNELLSWSDHERAYIEARSPFIRSKRPDWIKSAHHLVYLPAVGPFDAYIQGLLWLQQHHPEVVTRPDAAQSFTLSLDPNEHGQRQAHIKSVQPGVLHAPLYGLFAHPKAAKRALSQLALKHQLCQASLGILPTTLAKGLPCPQRAMHACLGACVGEESILEHNDRAEAAFTELPLKDWPYPDRIRVTERQPLSQQQQTHEFYRGALVLPNGQLLFDPHSLHLLRTLLRKQAETLSVAPL
ncbi:MAG: 3'-5' exonuclease [Neisseriaceae bacterium]|nr:3'-5' exonuclease [Neisseriaceae bacterium]MBP6863551.1 3'-5' exonuclease [Neisseriaceae bacterium]